jgi:hypothetical protein
VWKEILQEHILRIQREEVKPYIVGYSTYLLHIQIQKPFIAKQTGSDDQKTYDKSLKKGHVKINILWNFKK